MNSDFVTKMKYHIKSTLETWKKDALLQTFKPNGNFSNTK